MGEGATAAKDQPARLVLGMLQIHLRGGGTLEIPLRDDAARIQAIMVEMVRDIEAETTKPTVHDRLMQLRPGLWLRCAQVVAVCFSPVGRE